MSWPTANEFQQAVQDPKRAFNDHELRSAAIEINKLTGLPLSWSGAFAVVFKIRVQGGHHAVRCFTSNLPDQQRRYDAVSRYFRTRSMPPEFGEFEYQNDGILVNGNRHPILKMVWFDGTPLGKYVDEQFNDSQAMKALAAAWLETANSLQNMEIAHNDLQHGNIIVQGSGTNPTIKIVDYDGIFIPDFAGEKSPETGLPHYQHPKRDDTHYDREIDNFPALVIYTSLLALSEDPNLIFARKSNEALLFTDEDFQYPSHSKLFQDLCNTPDREVNQAANALQTSAMGPVGAVPRLSALAAAPTAQTQAAPGPAWADPRNAGENSRLGNPAKRRTGTATPWPSASPPCVPATASHESQHNLHRRSRTAKLEQNLRSSQRTGRAVKPSRIQLCATGYEEPNLVNQQIPGSNQVPLRRKDIKGPSGTTRHPEKHSDLIPTEPPEPSRTVSESDKKSRESKK